MPLQKTPLDLLASLPSKHLHASVTRRSYVSIAPWQLTYPYVSRFRDLPATLTLQSQSQSFAICCVRRHGDSPPHTTAPRQRFKSLTTLLSSKSELNACRICLTRLVTGVGARGIPNSVLNDAGVLHIMAAIRLNLFYDSNPLCVHRSIFSRTNKMDQHRPSHNAQLHRR